tara:strand:- start:71 stop:451 length:381 start_codon:yes stop_codon:yes gene_type:complete
MSIKNNNIKIKATSHFVKDRSSPENSIFLFSYDIKIKNISDSEVQLLSRYWHIQDGDGKIEEVRGSGVIGLQPLIKPNENFEYSSFCPLKTPFGMMRGTYQMKLNSEEIFDATIPAFSLHANEHIN